MASFYTEQQSLDVKDGLRRRVESGLFMGKAPYGYRNIRIEGRGLIETDDLKARKVHRLFDLYAYQGHTLDSLIDQLENEGIVYTEKVRRFTRSKLHTMLRDRAYIGEVVYQGQWYPGVQNPIIDRATFDRVGQLLGGQVYRSHELTYAGNLIKCGQCGRSITGETITKKNGKTYRYYRCVGYTAKGHKRIRLNEAKLDEQMLSLFDKLRVEDEKVRHWFARVLRERTQDQQRESQQQVTELNRQLTLLRQQQDQLLNLRLLEEINQETFASKGTELRDRLAKLTLQIESQDRGRSEVGEIAVKAFELSQTLKQQWLTADYRAKRRRFEDDGSKSSV